MTDKVDFPRLLREREHAGYSRDAMKAVYPSNCWPPEWADDDVEPVQDQETDQ